MKNRFYQSLRLKEINKKTIESLCQEIGIPVERLNYPPKKSASTEALLY